MKRLFKLLLVCATLSATCLAEEEPASVNSRYLKDGQLDPAYEGELVVFKGTLAKLVMGPGLHQYVQIDLPGSTAIWAGNFAKTTDPVSIFVGGDQIGVMGFLEKPQNETIAGIVNGPYYVTGLCFFNFTRAAAVSFSDDACAEYQAYNHAFAGQALEGTAPNTAPADPQK